MATFTARTVLGGAYNRGTIFRMSPGGVYTLLYTFAGGLDGGYPVGALVQGRDGNLFGVTYRNGAYDAGTAFVMTLDGEFGTLHWFRGDADGGFPLAGLIQGRDGNFYGTLNSRGAFNRGTVFRMAPNGDTTTLHAFAGAQDGASPAAPLMQAADGNFYGTTISGGGNPGYPYEYRRHRVSDSRHAAITRSSTDSTPSTTVPFPIPASCREPMAISTAAVRAGMQAGGAHVPDESIGRVQRLLA